MIGLGMGLGLLFLVLLFGGGILLALWLVKALFPAGQKPPGFSAERELSPREVLDRRYARGEIDREQYERIKLDLAHKDK